MVSSCLFLNKKALCFLALRLTRDCHVMGNSSQEEPAFDEKRNVLKYGDVVYASLLDEVEPFLGVIWDTDVESRKVFVHEMANTQTGDQIYKKGFDDLPEFQILGVEN